MFCPSCGCRNDDGTKFCCGCGAPIASFVKQPEAPVYTPVQPSEPPIYTPVQRETPVYNPNPSAQTPFVNPAPQYNPAPAPQYNPAPAKQPAAATAKSSSGIVAAISAIMAVLMFFLPWISFWGESMSYIGLMGIAGDLGWIADEAVIGGVVLILFFIAFLALSIVTAIKGFQRKRRGCGIAAGILGIILFIIFAIALEFEFELIGIGAILFFVFSILLLIFSCKK